MAGLNLHLLFQAVIHLLQALGHAIETRGHLAELVLVFHVNAGCEISRLHSAQAGAQMRQGVDDIQIAREQHHHCRTDGECHHHKLEQVENGSEA